MPLLATFIGTLFASLVSFLTQMWAKKLAVAALAIVGFATALAILMVMFQTLVSPLVAAMFQTSYGQFIGLAFPPMAGNCLASIGAAWAGCALYKLKVQSIKMTASA